MEPKIESKPKPAHVIALVPVPLREQVKRMAKENDRSLGAEIRQALRAHVAAHGGSEAA